LAHALPDLDRNNLPPYLTYRDLQALLQCSRRSLERKVSSGQLARPVALSRRMVRFRRSDILEYLARLDRTAAGR
jgi:predicted DNA-binding transcriptional regulator AlpA